MLQYKPAPPFCTDFPQKVVGGGFRLRRRMCGGGFARLGVCHAFWATRRNIHEITRTKKQIYETSSQ